jgi:hypothetical protein
VTPVVRPDGRLTEILEDLYLGRAPDYREEVVATAVSRRQRPAWTFPRHWLPVADIAGWPVVAPPVAWRIIATALLLIALLIAAAVVVGSAQTKVPPPFGAARNGVIAYSVFGDIFTTDASTGAPTEIVAGPALDSRPIFSRDGTKIAFIRTSSTSGVYDLMVAGADGSGVKAIATSPLVRLDAEHDFDFEWAPDSRSLIVYSEPHILRVDAVGSAPPTVISADAVPTGRLGPSGLIPYQPASIGEDAIWTVGLDGAPPRELIRRTEATSGGGDLSEARYSPDGSKLAFQQNLLPDDPNQVRIFIANADGTNARRLTNATGPGVETDFAWSPDGTRIAFNRWVPVDATRRGGDWEPLAIGIAVVGEGDGPSPVTAAGPSQGAQGAVFDWSPDGSVLIAMAAKPAQAVLLDKPMIIDVTRGEVRSLGLGTNAAMSWQRLAP